MNFEKLLGWTLFTIISWPIHVLFRLCCVISKYSSQLFSCFTQMGDQVTPGSICLTLAAQLLSLGESYLACDLGLRSNVGSLNVSDNTSHPGTQPARRLTCTPARQGKWTCSSAILVSWPRFLKTNLLRSLTISRVDPTPLPPRPPVCFKRLSPKAYYLPVRP